MEPVSIGRREVFRVLGIQVRIDPWSADYPGIWEKQYMPHDETVAALADGAGHYAVYFSCDEPGKVDMVIGRSVGDSPEVPEGLVCREVPAAQYAVFECAMNAIAATWKGIYDQWLAGSSDYQAAENAACFEYFPPGVPDGKAPVSIHVAVRPK